ncbi:MAG: ATPase, T2SS/T4P/T4SS family [Planctomycetota bacterium]
MNEGLPGAFLHEVALSNSTTSPSETASRLGGILVKSGRITPSQLDTALELKQKDNLLIGQALVELGFISEADLSDALKRQGKMACIRLSDGIVDLKVARELDQQTARRLLAVPINRIAGISTVAMADPKDLGTVDEIANMLHTRILPVHASRDQISNCLDFIHQGIRRKSDVLKKSVDKPVDRPRTETGPTTFAQPARDKEADGAGRGPQVVNMVRSLLLDAHDQGASDIHLEPGRRNFAVRFRIDGALHDRPSLVNAWGQPCIAHLKVLAQLDLSQSRILQDGLAQVNIHGKQVDLRIATTPSLEGEGMVIRLLGGGHNIRTLGSLGFKERELEKLGRMIDNGDGLVLAAGPTGSGRITTLYALVHELNQPHRKIITLEDPVEYRMEGITQIQLNSRIGLTYESGLRSILRQDPDVILVGEIRDEETARASVQASLTGRLVLSTLHTVGTVETISRLQNMGVADYLLADTLRGILAQRLVRTICDRCRRPANTDSILFQRLGAKPFETFKGAGCEHCAHTGYRGRTAIRELLLMTSDIRRMVQHAAGSDQIRTAAREAGMITLKEDALRLAAEGSTTIHEVIAATARG